MFISPERKISSVKGTGVQYIPGHEEKFVDYVINNYLPEKGGILDLGGGGFRFATFVALKGKLVTVVDLDSDSMNIDLIINRVNENGKLEINIENIKKMITTKNCDVFNFLEETSEMYSFISAFRLVHFFTPEQMDKFFTLVKNRLESGGYFVLSAITPYNFLNESEYNEIFLNSTNFVTDNKYYRVFQTSDEAERIKKEQNLQNLIHLIDKEYIAEKSKAYGFEIVEGCMESTRIVGGFILRKL